MSFASKCDLLALQAAYDMTLPAPTPDKLLKREQQQPTMVSTITSIQDMVRGLARASIPADGNDRYWQRVSVVQDRDMLLPSHIDSLAVCGCVLITLLLVVAVFR